MDAGWAQAPHETAPFSANMAALRATAPALLERVVLPVEGAHVEVPVDGPPRYRVHRAWYPFGVDGDALAAAAALAREAPVVWLFGLGLGELLEHLLTETSAPIVAWERDPWLLRLVLGRLDVSHELASGRLTLRLGVDLAVDAPPPADAAIVEHPFLATVYRRERHWLGPDREGPRALIQAGTLFVDDVADALEAEGYRLYTLDTRRLAPEEQALAIERLGARCLVAINYTEGLAEFCQARGVPLMCWEIDPTRFEYERLERPCPRAHVFTYRHANVATFERLGFDSVTYLPLATNPGRRRPLSGAAALDLAEAVGAAKIAAPVTYVGASLVPDAEVFRRRFLELYAAWSEGQPDVPPGASVLADVLSAQRQHLFDYRVPALLAERCPAFVAALAARPELDDPAVLVREIAASEKRLTLVANLAPLGVVAWGDAGFRALERHGVTYSGRYADHGDELTRIYSASTVNVDIGRLYQSDIVTMRVFDVLACGGCLLTEDGHALRELFEPGVHLDTYRSVEELVDKARWYVKHPDAGRALGERGRDLVVREHTIAGRVKRMLGDVL